MFKHAPQKLQHNYPNQSQLDQLELRPGQGAGRGAVAPPPPPSGWHHPPPAPIIWIIPAAQPIASQDDQSAHDWLPVDHMTHLQHEWEIFLGQWSPLRETSSSDQFEQLVQSVN